MTIECPDGKIIPTNCPNCQKNQNRFRQCPTYIDWNNLDQVNKRDQDKPSPYNGRLKKRTDDDVTGIINIRK